MTSNKPDKETLAKWLNDPNNWKWGLFYYNKADKRILPPKRIPAMGWAMGWTVNFANKKSILFFVAFLVIIMILIKVFNNAA